MASQWKNLDTMAGLGKLNSHLGQNSYIKGVQLSDDDFEVFNNFKEEPDSKKWPHINRWYNHVKYFAKQKESNT